jgi:hypothetical protein
VRYAPPEHDALVVPGHRLRGQGTLAEDRRMIEPSSIPAAKPKRESDYVSTSVNWEKRVLKKIKAARKKEKRKYRSVSAFVNAKMAEVLGMES